MNLPTISTLESLVPELTRLSFGCKSEARQINNFSTLLLTATRLWVIERSLYCRESDCYVEIESEWFNCISWLRKIEDKIPNFRDRSLEYFVLEPYPSREKNQWKLQILQRYKISEEILEQIMAACIFGVVDKTLRNNFQRLTAIANPRLEKSSVYKGKYKKTFNTEEYHDLLNSIDSDRSLVKTDDLADYFHEGVSSITQLLLTEFHGTQRLFIQAQYVAKDYLQDKAADWADCLKEVWKQKIVPPVRIKYHSVSRDTTDHYTIYPVAIHFFQRAFYLYGCGETPQQQNPKSFAWYSYRLERILSIEVLKWEDSCQTTSLRQKIYQGDRVNDPYTPNYIKDQLELAYGFNFHYDSDVMLLRFDRDYHQRYIKDTIRHATFKRIKNSPQVKEFIVRQLEKEKSDKPALKDTALHDGMAESFRLASQPLRAKNQLLNIIDRHPDDAYYQLHYRVGDNNVIMRLRGWSFNVEILLPFCLRQKMATELQKSSMLYLEATG